MVLASNTGLARYHQKCFWKLFHFFSNSLKVVYLWIFKLFWVERDSNICRAKFVQISFFFKDHSLSSFVAKSNIFIKKTAHERKSVCGLISKLGFTYKNKVPKCFFLGRHMNMDWFLFVKKMHKAKNLVYFCPNENRDHFEVTIPV